MTINTKEKEEQQKNQITSLLGEKNREELSKILVFGEKYKKKGKGLKKEFWNKYHRAEFRSLILKYQESEKKFLEGLDPEEKEILENLKGISREKFINEYLFESILYSGIPDIEDRKGEMDFYGKEISQKILDEVIEKIKPGMAINMSSNNTVKNSLGDIAKKLKNHLQPGAEIRFVDNDVSGGGVVELAKEWKDKLQQGMGINLGHNKIGNEGVKALAIDWKNKLQSGMKIRLDYNKIGNEGVKALATEWKNSLQPGMEIDLSSNQIGDEGIEALATEWKNSLQPGMGINLGYNKIGNEGVKALATEWKNSLQPGMKINLTSNQICDEGRNDGIETLLRERKDKLQLGMDLYLPISGSTENLDKFAEKIMEIEPKDKMNIVFCVKGSSCLSEEMEEKLRNWEYKQYQEKGIDIRVSFN